MYEVTTTETIDFYPIGISEILQNVATIISTPRGSVPLDRNFGIDVSMLDLPLEIAENLLTVQIMEAIATYEERVEVIKVTYEKDHLIGKLQPKVQVNIIGTE